MSSNYGSIEQTNVEDDQNITNNDEFAIENLKGSKNNIIGWYFYSFSSEPFVVSAVATYIPILLEEFARKNGVSLDDHTLKCTSAMDKCVLGLFDNRLYIDTSSFALFTFSISVFFQTLVVISVSGIVDVWKSVQFRRNIILLFGSLGALSTILISQLGNQQFYLLAALAVISNSCYGVVNVVGNSLLPIFVSESLKYDSNIKTDIDTQVTVVSGYGASIGYSAALLVQTASLYIVGSKKRRGDLQSATFFVGIWWLLFQLPMYWLINDQKVAPQQDTQPNDNMRKRHSSTFKLSYIKYGWISLFKALQNARLLKDVVIFLIGWFILSDSVTTINSTAILFAKSELKMGTVGLIILSILTMVNAIFGASLIPQYIAKTFHKPPQTILIYLICWASVIPAYGILGFFFNSIGLKHPFEMYIMSVWYGISLGGLSAVSRSTFSLIIPKGKESTFFSLFSVTDKGSSILGPFLIGLLTDKTHQIRYGFFLLFIFLMLSLPIFSCLNVTRGKKEAVALSYIESEVENGETNESTRVN
ncbi:hypothetical protein TPHA_0B04840 [Tetrapisispora phaffii CBS 4417]|uniref:Autophagy-related protein n=1 Tax=Tetrapisispora phaffii (strain ATCC 24235 / CBS 4417 / NBRC 1672 / NRRL Y-8282 / UCD 70-5) TaxID=1071381 RepID=G8BQ72_TETPH|nr:hypothetical protein TPHA_0B04840 [Tetrapisispora phaffii CBS 4417]CCE62153.1 hypothetical protein TPHA_0B04840 [Tetrapisispora phaffii CBS 4417]